MTRKDYIQFANMFRDVGTRIDAHTINTGEVWYALLRQTVEIFKRDNPAFDEAKFLSVAGSNSE